ncbi:hypothetical protein [Telmatospirillum siberiense]|uniref:Glycosyltransferase RgtA/B/C/D-like domain-containing protein n=1 Tax=Telmatospirillum siberiense TaxID=382514 RepID=A0A2N3PXZ9_9PROT|nr:hypothetical protein [Telmatospirillum siberiense]PKU25282.1 hypothetical protein CWS72_06690 [Telmatospirillum siberiense]
MVGEVVRSLFLKRRLGGGMPIVWTFSVLACLAVDSFYFPARPTFPDERRFLASAAYWLSDGGFVSNGGKAWEMPLPSMIFAALRWLVGGDDVREIYAIRCFQGVQIVLQSWLALHITRSLCGDDRAARLAGAIVAFYPFFLFYQGLALSETLFDTALLAFFAMLLVWRRRGCRIGGALIGVMILGGIATYARATLTILPPLLPVVVAWSKKCSTRHSLMVLLIGATVYAGMLSPWWIRNFLLFDAFVPFATSSSSVLYLGNNPANLHGDSDWSRDAEQDVVEQINAMPQELDRQAAYAQRAKKFMMEYPEKTIERSLNKIRRFWSIIPNADGYSTGIFSIISAISFGPVLILSIIGIFVNRHIWRKILPIYALIAYFTVIHALTVGSLRYRLPLEPFLIVLAAITATRFLPKPRSGDGSM